MTENQQKTGPLEAILDDLPARAYAVIGLPASPFSIKIRALMRYRRLEMVWIHRTPALRKALADVRPNIIPMVRLPDSGEWVVESTAIATMLEARHPGQRSIVPDDPATGFLALLIEDFADEWLMRAMFWHRYHPEAGAARHHAMAAWLVAQSCGPQDDESLAADAAKFSEMQKSWWPDAGISEATAPLLEASAERSMAALEAHLAQHPFLFGARPSVADFALYGQLAQLLANPVSGPGLRAERPRVCAYVSGLEDASGLTGLERDLAVDGLSDGVRELLAVIGEVHLPWLAAHERAIAGGDSAVAFSAMGLEFTGRPVRFLTRCLAALRAGWQGLSPGDRDRLSPILREAGCLEFLGMESPQM